MHITLRLPIDIKCLMIAVVSLSLSNPSHAQNIRHAIQPGFYANGGELQLLPDGTVRLIGMAKDSWNPGTAAISTTLLSNTGELLSTGVLSEIGYEVGWDFLTLPLKDGSSIVSAELMGCDYHIPVTIARISPTDTVEWVHRPIDNFDLGSSLLGMWQTTDSSCAILTEESLYHLTFNGEGLPSPGAYIQYSHLMHVPDGYLVLVDSTFMVLDMDFKEVEEIEFQSQIEAFDTTAPGGYFVVTTDSLFVLNQDLIVLKKSANPAQVTEHAFATSHFYWLYDISTNEFHKLDTSLAFVESLQVPDMTITDVLHIGDGIFVAANYISSGLSSVCLYTTPEDFSFDILSDIGISDIRLVSPAYSLLSEPWFNYFYDVSYGPTYVTLTNYGPTLISRAFVRFAEEACTFCSEQLQYEWEFTDLAILPGASHEVYLGDLFFHCANYDLNDLCFYTMNPNKEPDGNPDNDRHCITVDVISDIAEMNVSRGISIYPNPASEYIYFDFSDNVPIGTVKIALIDSHGREVWRNSDHEFTSRVPLNDIASGMYFLLIQLGSDQPVMEKIVVL